MAVARKIGSAHALARTGDRGRVASVPVVFVCSRQIAVAIQLTISTGEVGSLIAKISSWAL